MATTKKTAQSKPSKSVPKTATIRESYGDAKLPDRGENGTYSLRLLLDYYYPGVLATAIKKYGIHTRDRHGLSIHCTKTDNTEQLERAQELLADWQAELDDPGPEYSWDSERYYGADHPTEYWWLVQKDVNHLDEIRDSLNKPSAHTEGGPWTQRPLKKFEEELKRVGSQETAAKLHGVTRQRYSVVYNKKKKALLNSCSW